MRKIGLLTILVLSVITVKSYAIWPFGSISSKVDSLHDSVKKEFSDVKAGVNDAKLGINDVKSTVAGNTTELGVLKDNVANLSAKISANVSANVNAGYQTNANTTAGRDVKKSSKIYNDPKILLGVSGSLFSFMTAFMLQMFLSLRAKDKQISELMRGQQKFIDTQEQGQMKYIKVLEKIAFRTIGLNDKSVEEKENGNKV